MALDTTPTPNGRPGGATGLRKEAETFASKHPRERPRWKQYRTEEQEKIIADAATFRRNVRAQARKLGFTGPDAVTRMLDAWLPNALEVMSRMDDTPAMLRIATALEQIALELAARNAAPVMAHPIALPDWKCPVHHTSKLVPAGLYKSGPKIGQPRDAFVNCGQQLGDGTWCNERPGGPRTNGAPLVQATVSETLP